MEILNIASNTVSSFFSEAKSLADGMHSIITTDTETEKAHNDTNRAMRSRACVAKPMKKKKKTVTFSANVETREYENETNTGQLTSSNKDKAKAMQTFLNSASTTVSSAVENTKSLADEVNTIKMKAEVAAAAAAVRVQAIKVAQAEKAKKKAAAALVRKQKAIEVEAAKKIADEEKAKKRAAEAAARAEAKRIADEEKAKKKAAEAAARAEAKRIADEEKAKKKAADAAAREEAKRIADAEKAKKKSAAAIVRQQRKIEAAETKKAAKEEKRMKIAEAAAQRSTKKTLTFSSNHMPMKENNTFEMREDEDELSAGQPTSSRRETEENPDTFLMLMAQLNMMKGQAKELRQHLQKIEQEQKEVETEIALAKKTRTSTANCMPMKELFFETREDEISFYYMKSRREAEESLGTLSILMAQLITKKEQAKKIRQQLDKIKQEEVEIRKYIWAQASSYSSLSSRPSQPIAFHS